MSKTMKAKETKKVIKEFINHVDTLEKEEDPEGNGFNREYRLIQDEQLKNRRENVFSMDAGKSDNNLRKNRYKDILPYDDHRVSLSQVEGEEDSDYINASILMGVKGTGGYIASQGPLAATVNDYWRMIWEKEVEIVFMACRIVELGKIKCKQYWNDLDKSDEFGDITVFTEAEEELSSDFVRRKFRVKRGDEERHVTQFHYSGWPDHGIPDDPDHIRDLIGIMRHARQKDESPLLVHCSAGCGRTGAIIAIDFVWTLLEEGRFDESFNLYDLICEFRTQRMSIVQTPDQYALVYKVLRSLCLEWLTRMASHTYVNVELDQGQNYFNVKGNNGDVRTTETENIYEDTISGADQSAQGPIQDRKTTKDGPVIVDLPQPAANVTISPERQISSKVPAPQPPQAGTDNAEVHTTVIRIGANSSANKQTESASQGGTKDVTYVVQKGATKTTSTLPPKPSTPSLQPSPGPISPASPRSIADSAAKSDVSRGHKAASPAPSPSLSPAKPVRTDGPTYSEISKGPVFSFPSEPSKSPAKTTTPGGAVYSEVHKGPKTSPLPASTKSPNKTTAPGGAVYSEVYKGPKSSPPPASTKSPTKTTAPGGAVYSEVQKGPKISPPPAPTKSPAMITIPDGAVYATVDKDQKGNPAANSHHSYPQIKDVAQSGSSPRVSTSSMHSKGDHYSYVSLNSPKSSATISSVYETVYPSQINGRPVADHPPGFNERLPRVKGPVQMPQSWSKP